MWTLKELSYLCMKDGTAMIKNIHYIYNHELEKCECCAND